MSRLRGFTPFVVAIGLFVAAGMLVAVPTAWWLSLRREVVLASPSGRHSIHLTGRFSRPVFGVNHTVYLSVFDGANKVVLERQIHTGDWMDPWFDLWYPRRIWINDNILRLTRPYDEALTEYDQITVRNSSSGTVRFLRIDCRDMFLLLDITPAQVVILQAPMQAGYSEGSWVGVEGQFADQREVQAFGKGFTVYGNGARYTVNIRDDRVEVTLENAVKSSIEAPPPNNSLDRSGGSVFRIKSGAAKVE